MELLVKRETLGDTATLGSLFVDGEFECHTLEDKVRDLGPDGKGKVYGKTAIPAGHYEVVFNWSPKFQKNMIRILNVPFFDGILIHGGNSSEDTLGCILVGDQVEGWRIKAGTATPAITRLKAKVEAASKRGEHISIEVQDGGL